MSDTGLNLDLDQSVAADAPHPEPWAIKHPSRLAAAMRTADNRLHPDLPERSHRSIESYERELIHYRSMEIRLRDALAESEARLREQDGLIQQQELLRSESDHRLMNDLQMTISLLSLQSRAMANAEAAAQLAVAANRVATISRIASSSAFQRRRAGRRIQAIPRGFRPRLLGDAVVGRAPGAGSRRGHRTGLPAATAIPLGFIVSELITNAAKYGDGRIAISLQPDPAFGYALSVCNGGPALPDGFDPGASTGLGMRIVQSFARQIGGELADRLGRRRPGRTIHRAVSGNNAECRCRNAKPGNTCSVGTRA